MRKKPEYYKKNSAAYALQDKKTVDKNRNVSNTYLHNQANLQNFQNLEGVTDFRIITRFKIWLEDPYNAMKLFIRKSAC